VIPPDLAGPADDSDAIAIIVVAHESAGDLPDLTQALLPQLCDGDEVVIVDNASTDGTPQTARGLHPRLTVVETGANLGFSGGCQIGARSTTAPLLLFLNPDSQPQPEFLSQLRESAAAHPDWGAWQAMVLTPEGNVSGSGGIVHYLGIGWADDSGRRLASLLSQDREVPFPSGAAMIVRRSAWEELSGLDPDYFMYGEDLDFGLRLWLTGYHVGSAPSSLVIHNHEFDKGAFKWFWLERNRWRTVLSVYPTSLLLMLAPALLAAELGMLGLATRQGWLGPKLRAQVAVIGDLPRTFARRRVIQRMRRIGTLEFTTHLTSSLDSPYLTAVPSLVNRLQACYWRLVLLALSFLEPFDSKHANPIRTTER
jgi:GT2 family glycosyltransferase